MEKITHIIDGQTVYLEREMKWGGYVWIILR